MIPLRDANPVRRRPVVTIALIATCIVLFGYELVIQSSAGDAGLGRLFREYGLVPGELTAAFGPGADQADVMYRELLGAFTSMFLHGGWIHLIGNLLYLWIFGNNIEDRLGRLGFLAFYLFGGVAAATTQIAIDPGSDVPVIGASGAIAAVLGAYLVLYPRARVLSLVFLGFFYQLLHVPAVIVLGLWFVLQLIDGYASLGPQSAAGGVALFEHIGGFVAGAGVALIIRAVGGARGPRPAQSPDRIGVG
ncbi:MAG TPA: rhomboid family intramembrane serine protease [Patescibacteria group bacterium]|nr:rhomboid family intramembrane serine protease [Patescibacteria group bacterium]